MAIEAFLGTGPQKAFLFTICCQAVVVLAMVGIVYGEVTRCFPYENQFADHDHDYPIRSMPISVMLI
jgi:hypothetical protein